ncbi:MAG: 30S ribosome-binding factor RbfA [Acidobacteria bacterium]|nr:30S ribosome-binding factor RbfA [Acidobacteriota bacterium]
MTVSGRRQERLADQIRTEVAEIITLELKDPRIGFVTVTHVELSRDFRTTRVWVSVLGDEEAQQMTLEGLLSAAGYLRHEIGLRLRLRRVPELTFVLDRGVQDALKVESLLEKINGQN